MRRLLFLFLLGAAGALLFRAYLYEGIYLATDSMAPTLTVGAHIFVNKFVYRFSDPQRGDIIVFQDPQSSEKDLVKRIIAIGKDIIKISKKQVILNGSPVEEPYKKHLRPDTLLDGDDIEPVRVPDGCVFVMGDNRDFSRDSRDWFINNEWRPFLPIEKIKGRVRAAR